VILPYGVLVGHLILWSYDTLITSSLPLRSLVTSRKRFDLYYPRFARPVLYSLYSTYLTLGHSTCFTLVSPPLPRLLSVVHIALLTLLWVTRQLIDLPVASLCSGSYLLFVLCDPPLRGARRSTPSDRTTPRRHLSGAHVALLTLLWVTRQTDLPVASPLLRSCLLFVVCDPPLRGARRLVVFDKT
jgi:hypothetical protein